MTPSPLPSLTVVLGPPAAGKSTYVAERFAPGDVVVDWDRLLVALTMQPEHTWVDWVCPLVEAARAAVVRVVRTMPLEDLQGSVYVVACNLPAGERVAWVRAGARVVELATPREVCVERIMSDPERAKVAESMIAAVDRWWAARDRE